MSENVSEKVSEKMISAVFEYPVLIRETHLDLFGHVNNAVYLELFEEARWDIVSPRGFSVETIQATGHGPVVLEIKIKFIRELRVREKIVIRTWCASYTGKVGTLIQVMMNERGEEACRAEFVYGLFDLNKRRLIAPTPEWLAAIGIETRST
jgi:acyl-CoA thioester hydrolase